MEYPQKGTLYKKVHSVKKVYLVCGLIPSVPFVVSRHNGTNQLGYLTVGKDWTQVMHKMSH